MVSKNHPFAADDLVKLSSDGAGWMCCCLISLHIVVTIWHHEGKKKHRCRLWSAVQTLTFLKCSLDGRNIWLLHLVGVACSIVSIHFYFWIWFYRKRKRKPICLLVNKRKKNYFVANNVNCFKREEIIVCVCFFFCKKKEEEQKKRASQCARHKMFQRLFRNSNFNSFYFKCIAIFRSSFE